jgi:hypothetical protein
MSKHFLWCVRVQNRHSDEYVPVACADAATQLAEELNDVYECYGSKHGRTNQLNATVEVWNGSAEEHRRGYEERRLPTTYYPITERELSLSDLVLEATEILALPQK